MFSRDGEPRGYVRREMPDDHRQINTQTAGSLPSVEAGRIQTDRPVTRRKSDAAYPEVGAGALACRNGTLRARKSMHTCRSSSNGRVRAFQAWNAGSNPACGSTVIVTAPYEDIYRATRKSMTVAAAPVQFRLGRYADEKECAFIFAVSGVKPHHRRNVPDLGSGCRSVGGRIIPAQYGVLPERKWARFLNRGRW